VINAAAYTGVDRAEAEPDVALAINGQAPGIVAHACAARGLRFVHISTDYVFDGAATRPYVETDACNPINVYGATKRAGEVSVLAAGGTVLRTSWVFSSVGANFVKTMLRLASEREELRVVADQHGCPTHAGDLARLCVEALRVPAGLYHACGDVPTTWHGFATEIVDGARRYRELACQRVVPIATADYPTPAKRPASSILDTSKLRAAGIAPSPWRVGLSQTLQELLS
jgi:dTDP-4-dehydrorhamnose reductase